MPDRVVDFMGLILTAVVIERAVMLELLYLAVVAVRCALAPRYIDGEADPVVEGSGSKVFGVRILSSM